MGSRSFHGVMKHAKWVLAGGILMALQGCGVIYKTTGDVLVSYGRSELLPYMLTSDDITMACAGGEALTPLLMSFSEVGSRPERLGVMVYTVAAVCSDADMVEGELRYIRAMNDGNTNEAQDARISQKRAAAVSAQRQLLAYELTEQVYGVLEEGGKCPRLNSDFDEMVFMVGNLSGVQAVLNDATAEGVVGVPRNLAAKVERNMRCLDNEKWWGVPRGARASIWSLLPMLGPDNADAWGELRNSAQLGIDSGVRLGSALYAISAYTQGDDEQMKQAIRDFATVEQVSEEYKLMDAIAAFMVQGMSDRLWTDGTGRRTPVGSLGRFWDDRSTAPAINIDDLL